MRPKTQRAYRRSMNSYRLAFGFRPPYQLLADADFCMEATKQKLDMNKELSVTFQQPTKTFITECSIQELRKKGPEGLTAARMAREFERRRCPHSHKPIGSSDCLTQVVGPENKFNYCVLSQNEALRKRLREIPGIPMFYVKSHMIVMEPMTAKSKEIVKKSEQQKLLPTSEESEFLKAAVGGGPKEEELEELEPKKKKKIKGPNPLSVKKAKKSAPPPPKKRKRGEEDKKKAKSDGPTGPAPAPAQGTASEAAVPEIVREPGPAQTEEAPEALADTGEKKKKRKRRKKTKHEKVDSKEVDKNEDRKDDEE